MFRLFPNLRLSLLALLADLRGWLRCAAKVNFPLLGIGKSRVSPALFFCEAILAQLNRIGITT
jgi:hypothetical protein